MRVKRTVVAAILLCLVQHGLKIAVNRQKLVISCIYSSALDLNAKQERTE